MTTQTTLQPIPDRVSAGMAWLDEHEPGWDQRIDLKTLDVESGCHCVLGQLEDTGETYNPGFKEAPAMGFYLASCSTNRHEEYVQLTVEWTRRIIERRKDAAK